MPKFRINVVKNGTIVIDAPELDIATEQAEKLPDSAFRWERREFSDCGEEDGSGW